MKYYLKFSKLIAFLLKIFLLELMNEMMNE
jgi:hypothetical protein